MPVGRNKVDFMGVANSIAQMMQSRREMQMRWMMMQEQLKLDRQRLAQQSAQASRAHQLDVEKLKQDAERLKWENKYRKEQIERWNLEEEEWALRGEYKAGKPGRAETPEEFTQRGAEAIKGEMTGERLGAISQLIGLGKGIGAGARVAAGGPQELPGESWTFPEFRPKKIAEGASPVALGMLAGEPGIIKEPLTFEEEYNQARIYAEAGRPLPSELGAWQPMWDEYQTLRAEGKTDRELDREYKRAMIAQALRGPTGPSRISQLPSLLGSLDWYRATGLRPPQYLLDRAGITKEEWDKQTPSGTDVGVEAKYESDYAAITRIGGAMPNILPDAVDDIISVIRNDFLEGKVEKSEIDSYAKLWTIANPESLTLPDLFERLREWMIEVGMAEVPTTPTPPTEPGAGPETPLPPRGSLGRMY